MLNKIEKLLEHIAKIASFAVIFLYLVWLFIGIELRLLPFNQIYIAVFILLMIFISCIFNRTFYELLCKTIGFRISYIVFILPLIILTTYLAYRIIRVFFGVYIGIYEIIYALFIFVVHLILLALFKVSKISHELICKITGFKIGYIIYFTLFVILTAYPICYMLLYFYDIALVWVQTI